MICAIHISIHVFIRVTLLLLLSPCLYLLTPLTHTRTYIVLFDPDWNPASDKQAAGRIWREGQKRRCFIYRFMATNTGVYV